MITDAIAKLIHGQNLNREEAKAVFNEIMSGQATDAQIGGYLVAQRMRGETVSEITGAVEVMRAKVTTIPVKSLDCIDTCGTGGDKSGTFNISTASALVAATCGVPVAKHGNRSVSSQCGSADVLAALGVKIDLNPEQVAECIDTCGIGFLFAPALHGAMKYAIGPRREIAQRSIFNVLGPLTNPAGARRQVMGVFDKNLTEDLAAVLAELGSVHVWVVAGADGLDEITLTTTSKVTEYHSGQFNTFELDPRQYGFSLCNSEDLKGGSTEQNAQIIKDILQGKPGPKAEIVTLNAGAAIYVGGKASDLQHGVDQARFALKNGRAYQTLLNLIEKSQSF
jgi:anthranilate phosphoribosyltransferase